MTSRRITVTVDLSPEGAKAVAEKIGDGALWAKCAGAPQGWPLPASEVERYLLQGWPETCPICDGPLEIVAADEREATT